MGVNIKDILIREKTKLESFSSKIIAIDAYNAIYQFLATDNINARYNGSRFQTPS
jgi:flap endonuclease-1